ncbi:MAG: GNAT family N-acetyltransferase [Bacteroidetes bacterium]|nr:MAG: GNAT family N-acetyltransferase [Bacteroidota bacterium]
MKKEILFTDGKYTIQRHHGIPKEAMRFLESIAWGNEGAIYEHKNTEEHIKLIKNPMLLAIFEGDQIRATAVFSITTVATNQKQYNCNYIRYFASSKEIRGKGVMKKFSIKVMELIRGNEKEKTIYFACIERANKSSYVVVESAGYSSIGTVKTLGFSRYFPRNNKNIKQISTKEEKENVLNLLKNTYENHALAQYDSIFLNDNYYAIIENDQIVAGCQYHRAHWVINNMKGFMGKIVMNIVPIIPILNKFFNPKRFEFLAFEGIYFKPGHEKQLYSLFEGLLAKEKLKSSMFWLGKTSPIRKSILAKGKLGLIHTFLKDSDVEVLASFENIDNTEIEHLKSKPIYASAFDYI